MTDCRVFRQGRAYLGLCFAWAILSGCQPQDAAKNPAGPAPVASDWKTTPHEKEPKTNPADTAELEKAKKQAYADIERLTQYPTASFGFLEDKFQSAYLSFFGGFEYRHLAQFIADRVHWIMTPDELDKIQFLPKDLALPSGLRRPKKKMDDGKEEELEKRELARAASNVGTNIYLAALAQGTPIQILIEGQQYPVESSRVGIVSMGKAYLLQVKVREPDGRTYVVPAPHEIRLSILLHEARHSDCNAEITPWDLSALSGAFEDFERDFRAKSCGHLHVTCASNHPIPELRGQTACDGEPWGSYMTSVLSLRASRDTYQQGSREWRILDVFLSSNMHRLQQPFEEQINGRWGAPDINHRVIRPGEARRAK